MSAPVDAPPVRRVIVFHTPWGYCGYLLCLLADRAVLWLVRRRQRRLA